MFQAKLHGMEIKTDGKGDGTTQSTSPQQARQPECGNEDLTFKDPKAYEGMSQEERTRLTMKMMAHFKRAATKTQLGT